MTKIKLAVALAVSITSACGAETYVSKGDYTYAITMFGEGEDGVGPVRAFKMKAQDFAKETVPFPNAPVKLYIKDGFLYVEKTSDKTKKKYDISSNPAQPKLVK
jgi:hypothetical protein